MIGFYINNDVGNIYCIFDIRNSSYNAFKISIKNYKLTHVSNAEIEFIKNGNLKETKKIDVFNKISKTNKKICIRRIFSDEPENISKSMKKNIF